MKPVSEPTKKGNKMNYFPELTKAEITVKETMLTALKEKYSELEPLMTELKIEIQSLEEDIKRLQEKGLK